MKTQTKWMFLLLLCWFCAPLFPSMTANEAARIYLEPTQIEMFVGQEVIVDVLVANETPAYGADVQLAFDATQLAVVDADRATTGLQVEPGDFFDVAQAFVLQHRIDNEAGLIDYALTLLHPAAEVVGNGRLARIIFRAKAPGETTLYLSEAMLGTRDGATITPTTQHLDIAVHAAAEAGVRTEDARNKTLLSQAGSDENEDGVQGPAGIPPTLEPDAIPSRQRLNFGLLVFLFFGAGGILLYLKFRGELALFGSKKGNVP